MATSRKNASEGSKAKINRPKSPSRKTAADRERLLAAVESQRQLFQAVIEHAPAGIAIYDGASLRLKWANPTYHNRLDEPHRNMDISGMRLEDLFPGAKKSGMQAIFHEVAKTRRPHINPEQELAGLARGTTYWHWSLLPLSETEQETPDLMILVVEVTEQVLARRRIEDLAAQLARERQALAVTNQELQRRNLEVERANRLKSEFLASMSHELRTPLHSIIGFSELLAEQLSGEPNVKPRGQLDHVLHSARHLLSLINDVLDLSKIEAGRLELHPENFLAWGAIQEVLTTIDPLAASKHIRIENHVDASLVLRADRLRFKQILYNLLSNAVKFTPPGGSALISSAQWKESTEIAVRDSGIGIPLEEQSRIFDEFQQLANPEGVREGAGLGLAITRRLVESHGGTIRVESTPGQGSCFTFSLPTQAGPGGLEGSSECDRALDPRITPAAAGTPARRILVADDSPESREFVRDAIRAGQFEVVEAIDGMDAMARIQECRPTLVLLDIQMPKMDGYKVLRWIRGQPLLAKLPVVALTAFAMQGDRDKALSAGFDAYLSKPISPDALRAAIESLLADADSEMTV